MLSRRTRSLDSELSARSLWFTEGTPALIIGTRLFHRTKRPFFVGIIKPSPLPEITGSGIRRHFGTAITVQRYPINRAGDMNPVGHAVLVEMKGKGEGNDDTTSCRP